jgi:hypothetical protein
MTSRGWAAVGAVGGAVAFAQLGMLVILVAPTDVVVRVLALPALIVATVVGLVLGGRLGARVPSMTRSGRVSFGAIVGLCVGAAIGGSVWLSVVVSSQEFPGGLAAFIKGAVVGAAAGLLLGAGLSFADAPAGMSSAPVPRASNGPSTMEDGQ